jgi:hypothetical protein
MTTNKLVPLCLASLLGLLVTACVPSSRPTLAPALGPGEAARVAGLVHSRTTGVRTLAAVLAMQFAGEARQGTVELIVNYDASGSMRFSAFKNLVITTRPVFDLLFVGDSYRLELPDADGGQLHQGPKAAFVRRHPDFRAFWIIGEGFFLPGFDAGGQPPALVDAAAAVFTTRLRSGAIARWFVDPASLEITRAQIEAFRVDYGDYRTIGAYTLPGRVTLNDQRTGFTTRTVLKQVEINLPLPPGAFDVSLVPGRRLHTRMARYPNDGQAPSGQPDMGVPGA